PMQWRMVGRRGRFASWTIVGDPVQSSWPDPTQAQAAMRAALGEKAARRRFTLRTNYRNSAEIFELAAETVRGMAEPDDLPHAVRATGVAPRLRAVADPGAEVVPAVAEMLEEVEGTVGVITAMDRVVEIAALLDSVANERVRVVGSLDAKGLEYDGVVLLEPHELLRESSTGRSALYVALTRATQRLTVLSEDEAWRSPAAPR
ncbi:MAG: ATP-binding domain-containing protein, partial [Sciscionella sp.]